MNAPQFMAHVQHQQRASEYRACDRDITRAQGRVHYYATPEEELENAVTFREIDSLQRIAGQIREDLRATQLAALERAGLVINP